MADRDGDSRQRFLPKHNLSLFFLCLSLSLSVSLGGCGEDKRTETKSQRDESAASHPQPAYGDTLVEGSIGDATNLIPMLASDSASHNISGLIINGLVKYDKDVKLVGDLAESWEVSQGGLQITFKLRRGVTWHDGHPFTARDVLFGFQTITNPNTPTAYAEDFRQVKKAAALDDYTFQVVYEKPFAPALTSWGNLVVLPKHLLEGKDIAKSELGRKPVGTGPYRFREWISRDRVILEANPNYFEGRPYIDRYVTRVIPDLATMFLELKAGGLDLMGLTPIQYKRQTGDRFFQQSYHKYRYLATPIPIWGIISWIPNSKIRGCGRRSLMPLIRRRSSRWSSWDWAWRQPGPISPGSGSITPMLKNTLLILPGLLPCSKKPVGKIATEMDYWTRTRSPLSLP